MLQPSALPLLVYCLAFATAGAAKAACIDLKETNTFSFHGTLGAAHGEEASKFVVPERGRQGRFLQVAITNFYGKLIFPLTLIDIPSGWF